MFKLLILVILLVPSITNLIHFLAPIEVLFSFILNDILEAELGVYSIYPIKELIVVDALWFQVFDLSKYR